MKPIANWNEVKAFSAVQKLPAGAYIVKILDAVEETIKSNKNGFVYHLLKVSFDIADGEYIDYYAEDYRAQTSEDKRWKGTVNFFIPQGDGTEEDAKTARRFKSMTVAVEESNTGYTWNWDEKSLKGKTVGCVFRDEEWEWGDKTGTTARAQYFISSSDVAQGKYTIPAPKLLKKAPTPIAAAPSYTELATDDDLPF